jgi:potassium efflux system protein
MLALHPAIARAQQPAVDTQVQAQAQQTIAEAVEALQSRVRGQLEAAALAIAELKTKVEQAADTDATLAELKVDADKLSDTAAAALVEITDRQKLVAKRLEEIGAAPPEGQTEDAQIAADRKRLQEEKAQINAIVADGEVVSAQARDVSGRIIELRRQLFSETIFRHTQLNGDLFENAGNAAVRTWRSLLITASNALEFMWRFKSDGLFIALGATIVSAVVIAVVLRRFFSPLIFRDPENTRPSYIHRLSVAFWSATVPTLASAFVILCGLGFLSSFNVLRSDIFEIVRAFAWAVLGVFYVSKLARGIVSPDQTQWRLVEVSDRGARRIIGYAVTLAVINGLTFVLSTINSALDAPFVLTVVESLVASVATGITLVMMSFLRPFGDGDAKSPAAAKFLRFLLLAVGLGLLATALSGYVGLAKFASSQIVVTGAIIVTMYLGFLSGHAISQHGAFARTTLGVALKKRYRFDEIRLDQFGLVAGLLIYLLVLVMGVPLIMLTWGFRGADISSLFVQLFTEIHIGNINISLIGILVGVVLFFAGLFVTRWFQGWLDGNVMARSHVDAGVRNSVSTVLGYAGIVLAALLGISAAGFNLSSLALVAGALSLGIGFGLQTIVQNFVSGLILLVERPFKVGDWIVNGPVEGFVRRISVRATEIETFQNQSIIVPNSALINAAVGNWTLRNSVARSEIPVSVSYDNDPKHVMDVLLELARNHALVLTMPEPSVGFQAFGQYTMDFELRFHVADLFSAGGVRNDLRIAIIKRFREEGIEMPVPQRELNVHLDTRTGTDPLKEALAREGLPGEVIRRIVESAAKAPAGRPRGRKVDLADDNDGSPYDGMHHALRDDDDDADDGGDDPVSNR